MAQNRKAGQTYRLMLLSSILLQTFTMKVSAQVTSTSSVVYEGYPVQLQCTCHRNYTTWKYHKRTFGTQGELIYVNDNVTNVFRGRFKVENYGTESLSFLKNENVSKQDTGYYTCYCEDKNTDSTILLQVVPKGYPKCSVRSDNSKSIRKVGQSVTLTCDCGFDSNYPTIRWMREERQHPIAFSVNDNTVLEETIQLTEKDMDVTYTCILGYGSVMSAFSCSVIPFIYRPRANTNPNVTITNVGENVTINCSVSLENRPALSNLIYAWNETSLDKFSGRFVLGNENRSLQLFGLKYSDDMTEFYCRVSVIRTGAQDNAVALLRVNGSGMSTKPPIKPYTSTQNYSTSFIHIHSTSETLYTAKLGNAFFIYLGISLIIVFVAVVILCVYKLHKRRINSRSGIKTRVLSVKYAEIKPKTAVNSKSNGQIVRGIFGSVKGESSSQYEEVPDCKMNNVAFCGTDMINSEKYERNSGVQHDDSPANSAEGRNELIKPESAYAHVDETKSTEVLQAVSDPSIGSATSGESTRDTVPVYATINKMKELLGPP